MFLPNFGSNYWGKREMLDIAHENIFSARFLFKIGFISHLPLKKLTGVLYTIKRSQLVPIHKWHLAAQPGVLTPLQSST